MTSGQTPASWAPAEPNPQTQTFLHIDDWLSAWNDLRRGDHETLLLAASAAELTAVLIDRADGRLKTLSCPVAAVPAQSSPRSQGIGETWWSERLIAAAYPDLGWLTPDEPAIRGKGIFRYPLGPVRADVAEALLYRLSVMGDEIVHLELVNQFKTRHITALAENRFVSDALPLISRTTTTSNVHHTLAFVLAVESAWGIAPSPPAAVGRSLMAELERVTSHLGDLAALAVSTGLPVPQMEYLHLKESVLRINHVLFGSRYLRERIVPGGLALAVPPDETARQNARASLHHIRDEARKIAADLENTSSFLDRLHGAGRIPASAVDIMRPVGPVGRAAARDVDVRRLRPYAAYDPRTSALIVQASADSYGRFRVRVDELDESLKLVDQWLASWDASEAAFARQPTGGGSGVGCAVVEAPRGLLAYRVVLDDAGRLHQVTTATPSARNWGVLPVAMANGNILQDFPIIDASFSLSPAGWDG